VDERVDVWALCAVLHELLTDEYVFDGTDAEDVMRKVLAAPVPSLVEKAGVDEALWSIVERGLRKDRDERWSTAREVGQALATWLLAHGCEEDVTGASVRRVWLESSSPDLDAPRPRSNRSPAPPGTVAGIGPRESWPEASSGPLTLTPTPQTVDSSTRPETRSRRGLVRMAAAAALLVLGTAGWMGTHPRTQASVAPTPASEAAPPADGDPAPALCAPASAEPVDPPPRASAARPTKPSPTATSAAKPKTPPRPRPQEVDFGF
jgi:serine/threonine-protein kinase